MAAAGLRRSAGVLFALFALSGFTGLVYESVWSHYLKLFLGAAAFAQSFVLVAFMGGMALGAWLASRASARWRNLLAAYAWVEALIGVAALAFHPVFVGAMEGSLNHVIPALGSPWVIEVYKYALCAVLIVPQTVLLGMTFPLMSGAVIRRHPLDGAGQPASGHRVAMLYFTNSIGAAAGALAAAFWLIGRFGMPGTLALAGALNLLLAAAVLALARAQEPAAAPAQPAPGAARFSQGMVRLFLVGAGVTGAASFIYEIAWIRMLSLVLSSSFHAFELMLSAFITGLALGGLWIRGRIDRIANPTRFAGYVQVLMGVAALGTIFLYEWSFNWMEWALHVLQRNASSYPLFNLFSHGLAFAVMLPATFLAGMTLPLFTHALLRGGHGERALGQVYAANTLGAIAGVLLAAQLLVPGTGLKITLILGAALDIVLGAWLLRWSGFRLERREAFAALIVGLGVAAATARAGALEPARLASGVFRHGTAELHNALMLFYADGKTASVAVFEGPDGTRVISTNGKPDAGIQMRPGGTPSGDEYTMTLLGALPLLARPDAKTFANIGFGSGLTADTLLSHSGPRRVDAIEIEPNMVSGARGFYPRVYRVFSDPRVSVYYEDAKSYFARHRSRYDVIVSEPSNPWVNGVASLFTVEFYQHAVRYLAPDGLFVQWLHIYELDDRLLASMFGALDSAFSDYDIYQPNSGDLIVLAVRKGRVPLPGAIPAAEPGFAEMLRKIGITNREQVLARRLAGKRDSAPLFAQFGAPANSDYRPLVQLEAPRARYLRAAAESIVQLAVAPVPILEMLGDDRQSFLDEPARANGTGRLQQLDNAIDLYRGLTRRGPVPTGKMPELPLLVLRDQRALCAPHVADYALEMLQVAAVNTMSYLGPRERRELWADPGWIGCPLAKREPRLRARFAVYRAVAERDARAMLALGRAGLADEEDPHLEWRRFLLLTAVLGAQASGQGDEARRLWQKYSPALDGGEVAPFERYLAEWRP
ncbi:MAG TPA: fused MFS/spermidine synthase [Burkholderiales bacterium]|nr:fused MFS/spermidine synthase [Burkholderiales bacterium]